MSKTLVNREVHEPDSEEELEIDLDIETASTSGKRKTIKQKPGQKKAKKIVKANNGWDLVIEGNQTLNNEDIGNKMQICGEKGAGIKGNKLVFFKQWKKDGEYQMSKPYPEFDFESIDGLILTINYLNKIFIAKKK